MTVSNTERCRLINKTALSTSIRRSRGKLITEAVKEAFHDKEMMVLLVKVKLEGSYS